MVILSYEFTLVFLLFFCVYWACRRSVAIQNYLLILAGLIFVGTSSFKFLISLLLMWQTAQIGAYVINLYEDKRIQLTGFFVALAVLLGHLFYYKYSNFFISEINDSGFFNGDLVPLDIVLPMGVSFYTFQAISYLYDVYKGKIEPLPPQILLGILSFVPSLSAGPIFRPKDAAHQWMVGHQQPTNSSAAPETQIQTITESSQSQEKLKQSSGQALSTRRILHPYLAGTLIIFAIAKKIVLAGWLENIWVTPVFANPLQFNGLEVLTAVYAYSLQLFFDFSGYTDLAIALALLLGFRLPENFKQPYLATDIQDFWNRWHISLSHWIRDYLYIPLGGNRCSFWRVQFNVMMAFVLSGIWHGAGWNFFIWGAIHGIALVWLNLMKEAGYRHRLTNFSRYLANFITFNYVAFGWIFFRSETYEQSISMLQGLVKFEGHPFRLPVFVTLFLMLIAWLVYPYLTNSREVVVQQLKRLPWWSLPVIFSLYIVFIFSIAPEGLPGFIYANF